MAPPLLACATQPPSRDGDATRLSVLAPIDRIAPTGGFPSAGLERSSRRWYAQSDLRASISIPGSFRLFHVRTVETECRVVPRSRQAERPDRCRSAEADLERAERPGHQAR